MGQSDNEGRGGSGGLTGTLRSATSGNPVAERLLHSAENYLGARSEKVVDSLGEKVSGATRKLTDVANGDAQPGSLLGRAAKNIAEGESPGKAVLKGAAGGLKDKVKSLFGKGGSGSRKMVNIEESIEVGIPVRQAFNLWTQYKDFPKWSKAVQSVSQDDETKSGWNAKIFLSKRNWNAKITQQIPDQRIQWTSDGPKGTVDGVVTFHELAPNLTRILVALEYHPGGLFEKTGNLWRAQGRRARLDLKLYRRYAMMTNEEVEGWRGEIREGEVVRDHDEVVAEEQEQEGSQQSEADEDRDQGGYDEDEESEGEESEADEDDEDEADESEGEEAEADEDEADEDEADEGEESEADEDYDEEDEGSDEEYDEADEDYDDEDYDEADEDYDEEADDEEEEEEPPARRRRAS